MNEFILHLRDALREELDATSTYDKLLAYAPENVKSIIEEIRNDEINHQGRLISLIMNEDPSQLEFFNKGLGQND